MKKTQKLKSKLKTKLNRKVKSKKQSKIKPKVKSRLNKKLIGGVLSDEQKGIVHSISVQASQISNDLETILPLYKDRAFNDPDKLFYDFIKDIKSVIQCLIHSLTGNGFGADILFTDFAFFLTRKKDLISANFTNLDFLNNKSKILIIIEKNPALLRDNEKLILDALQFIDTNQLNFFTETSKPFQDDIISNIDVVNDLNSDYDIENEKLKQGYVSQKLENSGNLVSLYNTIVNSDASPQGSNNHNPSGDLVVNAQNIAQTGTNALGANASMVSASNVVPNQHATVRRSVDNPNSPAINANVNRATRRLSKRSITLNYCDESHPNCRTNDAEA